MAILALCHQKRHIKKQAKKKNISREERDDQLERVNDEKERVYQSAGIVLGKDDKFDKEFIEFAARRNVTRKTLADYGYDKDAPEFQSPSHESIEKHADKHGLSYEDSKVYLEHEVDKRKTKAKGDAEAAMLADNADAKHKAAVAAQITKLGSELSGVADEFKEAFDAFESNKKAHIAGGGNKDDADYKKLQRDQRAMLREGTFRKREILQQPANYHTDLTQGALVRTAQDGMNYARLFEMDISDPLQQDIFVNLSVQANQEQQNQLLRAGTPQQIKLFAETLAKHGMKVSKVIMDNLEPMVQLEAYQLQAVAKYMKAGMTRTVAEGKAGRMRIEDLKKELR